MKSATKIIIFIFGCFLFSIVGGVLLNQNNEVGGLLFISGPLLFSILLTYFSHKQKRFSFLKFNFSGNAKWYLISFLLYPIVVTTIIFIGNLNDITVIYFENKHILIQTILTQLLLRFVFAFAEEVGWRGFLETELKTQNYSNNTRHIFVGIVWALWHLPFILATPYTSIPYAIFIPTFILGVIVLSFIYGFLFEKTKSIWAGVLFHGLANTIAWSIIDSKFLLIKNPIVANISPESILGLLFFGGIAILTRRHNFSKHININKEYNG